MAKPFVTECRLQALRSECGEVTCVKLPTGVPRRAFGAVLMSMVALCTIRFRLFKRLAQELLSTVLNIDNSLGTIPKIEQQTSEALADPTGDAAAHVRQQDAANAD